MALVRIASGKTLAVQLWLFGLRLLFPELGTIGEADSKRGIGDRVDGRAGQMAEAVFPSDVSIRDGNSPNHRAATPWPGPVRVPAPWAATPGY